MLLTIYTNIEKWPLSILIGSLSSNSEAIVTAQTSLSSIKLLLFPKNKKAENQTEVNYLCKLYVFMQCFSSTLKLY